MFYITYRFFSKKSNNVKNINKILEFYNKQSALITKVSHKHNNNKINKHSLSESHSDKPFIVDKSKSKTKF